MKAICWHGRGDVRVDTVPDPEIQQPRDFQAQMQGQPVVAVCQVCSCYLLNSPQAIVQAPSMHTERL